MNRKKERFSLQNGLGERFAVRFSRVGLMSIVAIVAVETGTKPTSPAATLSNWRFDPTANQLEITLEAKTTPSYFLLDQPLRIVLDLPNTQLGKVAAQQDYAGAVRQVRVSQFDKNITRIVLELAPDVVLNSGQMVQLQRSGQSAQGDLWLLRPQIARQTASPQPTTQALPTTLPPATNPSPSPQQPVVSVPPVPSPAATPASPNLPANGQIVDFGQPLPQILPVATPSPSVTAPVIVIPTTPSPTPTSPSSNTTLPNTAALSRQSLDVLLLAGTRLNLRYAGDAALLLKSGTPQQAQLVLAEDVRNRNLNAQNVAIDNLIASAGTPVIGRFETDARGTRFVAQAIALQGQSVPLAAESEVLNPQPNAAEQVTAANSATIDPGEIVQIRLTQDLLKL